MEHLKINRKKSHTYEFTLEFEGAVPSNEEVFFTIHSKSPSLLLSFPCKKEKAYTYVVDIPLLNNMVKEDQYDFSIDVKFNGHFLQGMKGTLDIKDDVESTEVVVKEVKQVKQPVSKVEESKPTNNRQLNSTPKHNAPTKPAPVEKTETRKILKDSTEKQKKDAPVQKPAAILKDSAALKKNDHSNLVNEKQKTDSKKIEKPQTPKASDKVAADVITVDEKLQQIRKQMEREQKAKKILNEFKNQSKKGPAKFEF